MDEVRRCGACQQPAVVSVRAWNHTTFGAKTGRVTHDYRCQHCGAKPKLQDKLNLWVYGILGVILLPTIFGGALFLGWTLMAYRRLQAHPVVEGAPQPDLQYFAPNEFRRCGNCRTILRTNEITRRTHNGLPSGTEWKYACACGNNFTVASTWGSILNVIVSLCAIAGALGLATLGGWYYLGTALLGMVGVVMLWDAIKTVKSQFANPETDPQREAANGYA